LRRVVKNILKWGLRSSSLDQPLFRPYLGIGAIIALHRVAKSTSRRPRIMENRCLEISKDHLEWLIQYFLAEGYDIISLDNIWRILQSGEFPGNRFVSFTFDDGYIENYELVYPLFRDKGLPFAVYVTTAYPDGTIFPWWYPLEEVLLENDSVVFTHQGRSYQYETATSIEKERAFHLIKDLVQKTSGRDTAQLMEDLFGPYGVDVSRSSKEHMLTWHQIEQMSLSENVTIGAHSVNHHAFSRITDDEVLVEMGESKRVIESHIQKKVQHFAYPYGGPDEAGPREYEIGKRCHFRTMTTMRHANIMMDHRNYLECLPRIGVYEHQQNHLPDVKLIMDGLHVAERHRMRKLIIR
jgi:peptidoglycan/xylan/chitin deacetylase (PgdA/CDA1 family)